MLSGLSWHQSALSVEYWLWVDILLISIMKLSGGYQRIWASDVVLHDGSIFTIFTTGISLAAPAHHHSLSLSPSLSLHNSQTELT